MRKEFEMTEEQYKRLMDACKPVPYILGTGGVPPRTPQQNANAAWESLGAELGFKYMTVQPTGKGDRFFFAEVMEEANG